MIRPLTAEQAFELMKTGSVEVIDVRDPSEWSTGHLDKARLVPLEQLRASPKASLKRDGVIFVCAAGVRSETAARLAAAQGLREVYNLKGGVRAWSKAGLPLVSDLSVAV